MNNILAEAYRDEIASLPFADKIAGVVRVATYKESGDDYSAVKSFPVACDLTAEQCKTRQRELCPDSAKKSVIFFEDGGCDFLKKEGKFLHFQSTLRLLCWLNLKRIGSTQCTVSAIAIANIINKLPETFFSTGGLSKCKVTRVSEAPKSSAIFGNYTFDENSTQYLLHPFDYFRLDITTEFAINPACIDELTIGEPSC